MINRLKIKNYAIIDSLEIDFRSGLTVITGETGSGKSLILEALSVSLGRKAEKIMIRHLSEEAIVETNICNKKIRRTIPKLGNNRSFIDGNSISLEKLKIETSLLVDFHGQHDQQLILNNNSHTDYLDMFCGHETDINILEKKYHDLQKLRTKLKIIHLSSKDLNERKELLEFQADEIDAISINIKKDQELYQTYKKLSNFEKILKVLEKIKNSLSDNDHSLINQLHEFQQNLKMVEQYDLSLSNINQLFNGAMIQFEEANTIILSKMLELEINNEDISELEDRINSLELLKRKYGGSLESVIDYRKTIGVELNHLKDPGISEKKILDDIYRLEKSFFESAILVHKKRKKKSIELANRVEKKLKELNMPNSKFVVKIKKDENSDSFIDFNQEIIPINSKGIDIIEFYLSANLGEPIKPLRKVASGGEISRIMLAIKTVFDDLDPVATLVFDEIDSGISGNAAMKVAKHLVELSKKKQVICITHLSHIANIADHHLHLVKYVKGNNTFVEAKYLDEKESDSTIKKLFIGNQN